MAITDVNLAGYVRNDAGAAVSGITISLLHATTDSGDIDGSAEVTTNTNTYGYWTFTETDIDANYDIKIVSEGGGQTRYIPWADEITLKTVDTSVMKVRGAAGAAHAPIYLFANLAAAAGDAWRVEATNSDTFAIGSDKASAGAIIDYIEITNGASAAASSTVIKGKLTVGVDDTGADVKFFGATSGRYWLWDESADGVVQLGTLTVGVDDTGHDVKFFGASAGAYMEWDESADQLRIMGASADATTSTGKLLLATSLTDINANDVIGKIDFQAPHEAGGTDAITVAASIKAIAQGTFSASVNATDLIFYTGHSEAATEKFRITSQGELGIGGATYGSSGDVLTSGGAGAAPTWATPTTGDITGVTAGVDLSGGGSSGAVTLTLDFSELSTVTPADGDFFATLDSDGANEQKTTTTALATLFAGAGMTATSAVLNVIGGDGITANANDVAITAAQTTVTSVYNASLKMGRDSQNLIDFATTDNKIILRVNNVDEVELVADVLQPTTNDGVALGTASLGWSDLHLAAQGVINWANGEMTITEGDANTLTVAGGTFATAALTTSTIVASDTVTANAGVVVDNITIDGTEIDLSSGDLTLDVAGDIILDAAGANVVAGGDNTTDLGASGTRWRTIYGQQFHMDASADGIANQDYAGMSITVRVGDGADVGAFDLVCISDVTNEVQIADASAIATSKVMGINPSNSAISDNSEGTILLFGIVRNDAWGWTTGQTLYLSETAGDITATAPTTDGAFVVPIGIALEPDMIYFNPSQTIIEHA